MECDKVSVQMAFESDGEMHYGGFSASDCDLGIAIASAITKLDPPRICQVVASIVKSLADWGELDTENYFPCHVNAVDDLFVAALKIIEGWDNLDAQSGI